LEIIIQSPKNKKPDPKNKILTLKIKNQKSGGTLALFEKDSYLSVSQSVKRQN
jgi:hypothetical protein